MAENQLPDLSKLNSVPGPRPLESIAGSTSPEGLSTERPIQKERGHSSTIPLVSSTIDPHLIGEGTHGHVLLRKEVIQPHLPVRLPCYDFVPIASPTFDGSLHKGWATGFGCCRLS